MSHNTIRTFIAVDIHPAIQKIVQQVQDHLKKCDCNIKWVNPNNIHLTLKFLGDVKLKIMDDVVQAISELTSNAEPFETELTQLGSFPSIDRPRILWVGLKDDQQNIVQLAESIENKFGSIGFKKESKPFSPHITIGRIRTPRNLKTLSEALSEYELPTNTTQTIQDIALYKSTLTSTGAIYEKLGEYHLSHS